MRAPESHVRANTLMGNIALGLLGFTLFAFALKAAAHPEVQARYTPIVVFHAVSMVAWLGLLATQAFAAAHSSWPPTAPRAAPRLRWWARCW